TTMSTTITKGGPMPLTYSNLIASNLYTQREAASSSESVDSNASTIKLTSGTPPPQQLPNYYVPPKVNVQESDSQDSSSSTSMSSTCSTSSSMSSTSYVLPPRLVRKKSGELVKSSLKLPQLLQRSLSTPQLPARKSVRFASRLTNIKMFDGMESPAAVSSTASTPLHSPPSGRYDDELDDFDDELRFLKTKPKVDYFDWNWHGSMESSSSTSSDDEDEYWSTPKSLTGNSLREYRLTSHNIPKIVNFKDMIVWLPSAYVLKTDGMTYLYGLVNVKNLAFEKKIFIKLTLNNWKTSVVFGGNAIITYVKSMGDVDQFKFKINVDDLISNRYDGFNAIDLQMCIKYEVGSDVYWDNNGGANYQFKLTMVNGIKSYTYSPSPSKNSPSISETPKKAETEEFPQFNELISKLILHQQVSKSDASLARRPTIATTTAPQQPRFSFSVHNNFEDRKPQRPFLRTSYSSSDVTTAASQQQQQAGRPKYSQSFRQRQQKKDTGKPEFSSVSYADLLNNYCFANTAATAAAGSSTPTTPVLAGCLPSTASTLHSFSDSIHI
ncbi:uncharacterized protein SPAPADRAFT_144249, partial [Spathaspora passalidarum NRRL Y-27907]